MSLPIKALQEETKIYDELIDIVTYNYEGKEYTIQFHPLFAYKKIRQCVFEIGQFFQNAVNEKLTIDPLEEDHIVNYFIIKHFSKGLKFTTSKKVKTIYNEFKIFYNSSLYQIFLNEVFTSEMVEQSRENVYKEIFNNIELAAKFEQKWNELQGIIENLPLENKEILENLKHNSENNAQKES